MASNVVINIIIYKMVYSMAHTTLQEKIQNITLELNLTHAEQKCIGVTT